MRALVICFLIYLGAEIFAGSVSVTPRQDLPFPLDPVEAILTRENVAYLAGDFWQIQIPGEGTVERLRGAAIDLSTDAVLPWNPRVSGHPFVTIPSIAGDAGTIFLGGLFRETEGAPRRNLTRVNTNGVLESLQAEFCCDQINSFSQVHKLAVGTDRIFLAGTFSKVNGAPRNLLASLSLPSGELLAWNPGPVGDPGLGPFPGFAFLTLTLLDQDRVLVGGEFNQIGGSARKALAMVNTGTGAALPWNPLFEAEQGNPFVRAMAVAGGVLYVGGHFSSVNGQPRAHLAAFDLGTGELLPWNPSVLGYELTDILAAEGTVFVAGSFTEINGNPRQQLAALDRVTGAVLDWNVPIQGQIKALGFAEGSLLIGGSYLSTDPEGPRNFLVFPPAGWSKIHAPKIVNGRLELTLLGEEGRTYILEQSTDLASWSSVFTGALPKGKLLHATPIQGVVAFYRLRLL